MLDRQSKRFDTLRAGDELNVLGLRAVIVEIKGQAEFSDLWDVVISFDLTMKNSDTTLSFPADRWVDCKSNTIARQMYPTARELHPSRKHLMQYPSYAAAGVTVRDV